MFYGFAENKEMEINLDQDVQVQSILVNPGQVVSAGEPLVEVGRISLELELEELEYDITKIKDQDQIRKSSLQSQIKKLELDKKAKTLEIENELARLRAKVDQNRSLLKDIGVVDQSNQSQFPIEIQIKGLEDELTSYHNEIDVIIKQHKTEIAGVSRSSSNQIGNLENRIEYFKDEQEKLVITAPDDGVVGTIRWKEGEHVNSFSPIISFYKERPTMVKGYVHESLILQVNIGDSLTVVSSLHNENKCPGVVVGLGSRIIEIPNRLSKTPEQKQYGREVLISIPPENKFLQKEKVMLNEINGQSSKNLNPLTALKNLFQSNIEAVRL